MNVYNYTKNTFVLSGAYCDWALQLSNTIYIAHNAKGYDSIIILNNIVKNRIPTDAIRGP